MTLYTDNQKLSKKIPGLCRSIEYFLPDLTEESNMTRGNGDKRKTETKPLKIPKWLLDDMFPS